jgi:hypothetical protein
MSGPYRAPSAEVECGDVVSAQVGLRLPADGSGLRVDGDGPAKAGHYVLLGPAKAGLSKGRVLQRVPCARTSGLCG